MHFYLGLTSDCNVPTYTFYVALIDTQITRRNFQLLRVLGYTLRLKAEVNLSSKSQKDFIFKEENRKAAWGHAVGPGNWCSHGSVWKFGLYSSFCIAPEQRCLLGANRHFLGISVSLANYHLLEPPAVRTSSPPSQ
jgi:hypothetical protein